MEDSYSGFSTPSELSNVLSHQNDAEPLHGVPYEIQYSRSDPQIVAPDPVYMSQPDFESHRTLRARFISAPDLNTVPVSYVSPGVASVNSITSSLPTATPPEDQSKSIRQFEPRAATAAESHRAHLQDNPDLDPTGNCVQSQNTLVALGSEPQFRPPHFQAGPAVNGADARAHRIYDSYHDLMTGAGEVFGHVGKRAGSNSRHHNFNISYADFAETSHPKPIHIKSEKELTDLCQRIPTDITHRLFIVEDLSSRAIAHLGSCLNITPKFFEEHLVNSGYTGAEYHDPPARSWMTSDMQKSYISMKWFRPVWRLSTPPYSKQDLDDLLSNKRLEKEKVDKGPPVRILKRLVRVFEQASSRVRLNVDSDSVFQSPQLLLNLKRQIYETNSTRDTFHQLFEQSGQVKYADGAFGVLDPLFQIVQQDMLGLLKLLNNVLQSITLEVLDDDIMEERLSIWRQLIARAQLELPEIRRAMEKTFTFLQATDAERADASGQSGVAPKEWQDLFMQIEDLMRKLQAASISLTSNMSLLDSRRSIAEAHSITKLTELAFFFIPLTFAATLFGMQVQPREGRAPLSTFILLGVTLSALSYLVRLALRSTWLRDLRQTSSKSIKAFADRKRQPVQRGDVPTSLFLKWMFIN
ncbi:hypothetical protein MANI_114355 [Metarhizium anisopliae]|nr:hypothetical protein MANI_114355 [Metarhizium anisopliae]